MSNPALECIDVSKTYVMGRDIEVKALRNVSLTIRKGDFVSIVGPSGSGKSTLLHIAGTLDRPTSGRVLVDGVDVTKLSENQLSVFRKNKIGFVFQFFNLLRNLSALENVMLPMLLSKRYTFKEARLKALYLLKLVGFSEDRLRNPPSRLSGGQQQKVAIARALANNPAYILADEPTGNLDVSSSTEIIATFKLLNSFGNTIIIVTHNVELARITNRILFMKDGQIFEEAPRSFLEGLPIDDESIRLKKQVQLDLLKLERENVERLFKKRIITGETYEKALKSIEEKELIVKQ
ncbi:MAG: ABC transporter ATP-binding protein [Thaumarchaeota archaeon]|jgi:putative ABC transport system ATP-binding protein|nr:ABC transporter ATP-binding protein [Nitrososphaerota archaeon]